MEPIGKFSVIGASKFLQQTGHSYYGDIYTAKADKKDASSINEKNLKKKLSVSIENTEADKQKQITTCLCIPKEKLHLIPFFDLYLLR